MKQALKDEPLLPFRIPNGIRNVQINATTGARANPGDEKVIWEAFTQDTLPTENMYILDGTGINLVSDSSAYYNYNDPEYNDAYQDPYNNNALNDVLNRTQNNYDPQRGENALERIYGREENPLPPANNNNSTGGTGGLY